MSYIVYRGLEIGLGFAQMRDPPPCSLLRIVLCIPSSSLASSEASLKLESDLSLSLSLSEIPSVAIATAVRRPREETARLLRQRRFDARSAVKLIRDRQVRLSTPPAFAATPAVSRTR